ncbi:hypothetical protein VitviT2T_004652 [Vitis vinifera]|uniref:U-box domain-containing protein n=3 Tax=Vitis vinifera TaxID=29760 RepID=A0ABY9BQ91_VITVI|nr:U-box domain-containing protein 25 [Vitis vinifera]WJZ85095.1 hypothetical protein VitviT2T_004652 [Vitis vinifera]|eukprot:XP_002281453.1 PREDICTED: U-box domain-containing protein 25 [Vitis vinifera]
MKTEHPKLKTTPRPLFSCGFFSHCTQSVISPTTPNTPSLPLSSLPTPPPPPPPPPPSSHQQSHPHPPPPPPHHPPPPPDSESSSSSTSQSFTQWRFPLPNSLILHHHQPPSQSHPSHTQISPQTDHPPPSPPLIAVANLEELFHVAELQLSTGSDVEKLAALQLLERSLVPAAGGGEEACPAAVMRGVVGCLKDRAGARPATKVLLALCLAEGNRHVAVEAGAVAEVVEAMSEMEGAVAERALAALELMCTVAEGAAELRAHALSVPMMISMMESMAGRGKECAISILAVIYIGAGDQAPPSEEVARAVALALQGDCSARGKRKGAQLLRALQENGRLELTQEG